MAGQGPVEVLADQAIEWRRDDQVVIARGNARATRDGTTVFADRLLARYRPRAAAGARPADGSPFGGTSEVWRLEAEGNVRIVAGNDRAQGDRAIYDLDRRVLVLTGRSLALTNGTDTVTARDSLEYWSANRMAVARGQAVVASPERRLEADTIAAWFADQATAAAETARGAAVPAARRLERAEAWGEVRIITAAEVVRGDRGVYLPAEGVARLYGAVRITRGQNQLNGAVAEVNLRTGVSRLLPAPGGRVAGMLVPEERRPPAPALEGRP
ncbi:MAG: LptA/OstA family protein [Acetobacteraceae bacterium]|nr:LptA/OstA family protein [Acetobacteraceae bacterium]